ncbi:MAG: virulence factor Mce family protein [Marmoricola sp.]|nr:virulence factor Mce family protein [Marmoricola sp.]
MKIIHIFRRMNGLTTVVAFSVACLVGFAYLWSHAGGTLPGISGPDKYRYTFRSQDVKNLISNGEVRIAGVQVGRVENTSAVDGAALVTFTIQTPLHRGATVRVGLKNLVGSAFLDVVDGHGASISSGSQLPTNSVIPAVNVDELYQALDPKTRASLTASIRSLAQGTHGRGQDLDALMTGLGRIGDQGGTALAALSAQTADLESLTVQAHKLLDTLDVGRGQIAALVQDANVLSSTAAAKKDKIEQTVAGLPGLVKVLDPAAQKLDVLGRTLAPVARDLRASAPDVNTALLQLPSLSGDLNGLVPDLNSTLDQAPATLQRVAGFDNVVRGLVPNATSTLKDADPMLAYLAPYGLDLGALFDSFGSSFDTHAEDGTMPIRLTATAEGAATIRNLPVDLQPLLSKLGGPNWVNPYPKPVSADKPAPFAGKYPDIKPDK